MYLITLLPTEINDDIIVLLNNFDLALQFKRFWAASQLYSEDIHEELSQDDLMNIIHFLDVEKKSIIFKYASIVGHTEIVKMLLGDPRIDPSTNNNCAIRKASKYGHIQVVKLLLSDPRVDPSAHYNCAIR